MLQKLRNNSKGFTLIELMIVIAIIGILAAIAVPQFMTYRIRAYNTGAKTVAHNLKADNANLNSELSVYGHTEGTGVNLTVVDAGEAEADTTVDSNLEISATGGTAGARLVGTTTAGGRSLAVGISLGRNMIAHVIDFNNANDDSTHHTYARHFKGDTAYGIDEEIENVLYSVSDPTWRNVAGLGASPIDPPVINDGDCHDGVSGGGATISPNWTIVR